MGATVSYSCINASAVEHDFAPELTGWTRTFSYTAESIPRLLHVYVPRGATWTSGLYRLVEDQRPNGFPVWQATHGDLWMYSMSSGKWGIGGKAELNAGFQAGAAFVFCDVEHGGALPCAMPAEWLHNSPAWTHEPKVRVEEWPETVVVSLQKKIAGDRFGVAASVASAETATAGSSPLTVQEISEDSLLAAWNADASMAGNRHEVVHPGSEVIRVGKLTDPEDMLQALEQGLQVEVEFRRPSAFYAVARGSPRKGGAAKSEGKGGGASGAKAPAEPAPAAPGARQGEEEILTKAAQELTLKNAAEELQQAAAESEKQQAAKAGEEAKKGGGAGAGKDAVAVHLSSADLAGAGGAGAEEGLGDLQPECLSPRGSDSTNSPQSEDEMTPCSSGGGGSGSV